MREDGNSLIEETDRETRQRDDGPQSPKRGLVIDSLARLPEMAILDESRLAETLQVTTRTVRRMVARFELPPPVSLAGRSVWMAGRVLRFIENAIERAEQEAAKQSQRIRRFSP